MRTDTTAIAIPAGIARSFAWVGLRFIFLYAVAAAVGAAMRTTRAMRVPMKFATVARLKPKFGSLNPPMTDPAARTDMNVTSSFLRDTSSGLVASRAAHSALLFFARRRRPPIRHKKRRHIATISK